MKIVVLDRDSIGTDLDYSVLSEFGELTLYDASSADEVAAHIGDAEVAVLNKIRIDRTVPEACPALRLICIAATGYDNIDTDACREKGVAVCNVRGYSSDSVAQLTLSTVLYLACHMPEYTEFVRSGEYSSSGAANRLVPVYHELAGMTWGVVGYGDIGRRVANVARAFGCRVLVNRRTPDRDSMFCDIDTLCRESDIITLHVPLSAETEGLINEARLSVMKNSAILVNMARGRVTDEAAVARAVKDGRIAAFGCDVYSNEPFDTRHPYAEICTMPNVCLTPHMAWGAYEARVRCLNEISMNIKAFLEGKSRNRV